MEERYSRTVREGDRYASLRHVAEGIVAVNVGKYWDADGADATSKEWVVSIAEMDLLVKIYSEWRRSDRQTPQEVTEKSN